MHCRYCGYKVRDKHVYCRNCGQIIVRTQQVVEPKKEIQKVKEVNEVKSVKEVKEVQQIKEVNKVRPIENTGLQADKRKKRNQKFMIAAIATLSMCVLALLAYIFLKPIYMDSSFKKTQVYFMEAEEYFLEEDYEEALEAYNEILELNPNNEKAMDGIVSVYQKKVEKYLLDEAYKNAILCAEEGYEITENEKLMIKKDEILQGEIYNEDGELTKKIEFNEEYDIVSYSEIKYDKINDLYKEFYYDVNDELLYTVESLEGSDLLRSTYYSKLGEIEYTLDKNEKDMIVIESLYTKGVLNTKIEYGEHNEEVTTFYYVYGEEEKTFQYDKSDNSIHIDYADDGSYIVYVFDEDNIHIGNYECDKNRMMKSYVRCERNEENQLLELITYNPEGILIDRYGFEYTAGVDEWSKQIHYLTNGELDYYIEYEYDENGNKISESYYNADGTSYSL